MILNNFDRETKIYHFAGNRESEAIKGHVFEKYVAKTFSKPPDLTIITCYSDEYFNNVGKLCLDPNGIEYINAHDGFNEDWYMPNKIRYILFALNKVTTKYVLIVDAGDVLIESLSDLQNYLEYYETEILFCATSNNFPRTSIDVVPYRDTLGVTNYLNAGCCVGYHSSLLRFYSMANLFLAEYRGIVPFNSEQFIIRRVFSLFSAKVTEPGHKFVTFDYNQLLFSIPISGSTLCALDRNDINFKLTHV